LRHIHALWYCRCRAECAPAKEGVVRAAPLPLAGRRHAGWQGIAMRSCIVGLVLLCVTMVAAGAQAQDGTRGAQREGEEIRIALVVGNGSYDFAGYLPNPTNDAQAMADMLRELGFEVYLGLDLDKDGFEALLRQFTRALDGADVGLFFYAGHGLQVDGINYI